MCGGAGVEQRGEDVAHAALQLLLQGRPPRRRLALCAAGGTGVRHARRQLGHELVQLVWRRRGEAAGDEPVNSRVQDVVVSHRHRQGRTHRDRRTEAQTCEVLTLGVDPVLAAGALHHLAVVVVFVVALVTQWTEVPWRETGSQQGFG